MNLVQEQEYYLKLGNNIRDARLHAGLSQEILADQLSLSRASIVNIEKGRQRILVHTVVEIAEILKVELHDLLPLIESTYKLTGKLVASGGNNVDIISDQDQIDKGTEEAVMKFVSFLKKDQ